MIRVTVELVPFGVGEPEKLATMLIGNDLSGSPTLGNYNVRVYRKGQDGPRLWEKPAWRRGRVVGYPRKRAHVWHLVHRALEAAL